MLGLKFIFILLFCIISPNIVDAQTEDLERTLSLLKYGDNKIEEKDFENVILVLGSSAAEDSSAYVKLLANVDENLISTEVDNKFIIKDEFSVSKSSYPKLYYSNKMKAAFYDCTGFSAVEANDPSLPIMTSFYVNKIVQNAKNIKILFLIDYSHIVNNDTNELLKVFGQAKYVFNSVNNFSKNIGLIVTNVDINAREEDIKSTLWDLAVTNKGIYEIVRALFVTTQIFRQNREIGPVNTLPLMGDERRSAYIFINKISYKEKALDDFKVIFPQISREYLSDLEKYVSDKKYNLLGEVNRRISKEFKSREQRFDDITEFQNELIEHTGRVTNIIDSYYETLDPKETTDTITQYLQELSLEVPIGFSDTILKYDKILRSLTDLDTDRELTFNLYKWVTRLEFFERYINKLADLYKFFIDLYNSIIELSDKDMAKFKVKEIYLTIKDQNKTQLDTDSDSYFRDIISSKNKDVLKYGSVLKYYRIENKTLNNFQQTTLVRIFKTALEKPKVICDKQSHATITGFNLRLNKILGGDDYRKNCANKPVIEIFAMNKLIIDEQFSNFAHDQFEKVLIIAPVWEFNNESYQNVKPIEKTTFNFIGIGSKFVKGDTSWNLTENIPDQLSDTNYLRIIGLDDKMPIDIEEGVKPKTNLGMSINRFKQYYFENFQDPLKKKDLLKFLMKVSTNFNISSFYNAKSFYYNFDLLEKQYYNSDDKSDFLPLYESLSNSMKYNLNNFVVAESDHGKVLNILCAATLSKIMALKSNSQTSLIIYHEKYLSVAKSNVEEFREVELLNIITRENRRYNNNINRKIAEGMYYIEKEIKPEADEINRRIVHEFEVTMVKEIKNMIKKSEKEKKKLKIALIGQTFATILSTIGIACSFLGPVGAAVGGALSVGSGIIKGVTSTETPKINESLRPKLNSLNKFIKAQDDERKIPLVKQIDVLNNTNSPELIKVAQTAAKYLTSFDKDKYEQCEKYLNKSLDFLKKREIKLPAKALAAIEKVKSIGKVAVVVGKSFKTISEDIGKIGEINSLLLQKDQEIENLKSLRNAVTDSFVPMLRDMAGDLDKQLDNMRGKSRISLTVKQWKIQQTLADFQSQMKELSTGFPIQESVMDYMNKLNRAIEVIIIIFNKIQEYEEKKEFADYTAAVYTAGKRPESLKNLEYQSMFDQLNLFIQSNIVVNNYKNAVKGLKQFVFPFAHFFSKELELPEDVYRTKEITDLAQTVARKISDLEIKTREFLSVHSNDRSLDLMNYHDIPNTFVKPFYVWKEQKHKELISNLLEGKEIILESELSSDTRNALKFSNIEFSIKSNDPIVQKTLDTSLSFFYVSLIHLGNSYYKCGKKVYVITSSSVSLSHSFYKDEGKHHIYESNLHETLAEGKFLLSPYASWQVKLMNGTKEFDHSMFNKIDSSSVYLELSGRGQYVPDNVYCGKTLENYYKVDERY